MEQPGTIRVDPTLQAAVSTVKRVKALVAEVKALDDSRWVGVAIRQGRVAA
jgi:hypothetical protein